MTQKDQNSQSGLAARLIGTAFFGVTFACYLCGTSWSAFPGMPAWMLRNKLDPDFTIALGPLWGGLIRSLARLPGLSPSGWSGLLSAVCGAGAVALLVRLMMDTGYRLPDNSPAAYDIREAQARRISGIVAGLFLAACIPFGVAATRSLPLAFHILLLLVTAWLFSGYQRRGRLGGLALTGLFYGLGVAESPTFLVLLPAAIILVMREMYCWRALGSAKTQAVFWGGLCLGLLAYPLHAAVFFRQGLAAGQILTFPGTLEHVVMDPLRLYGRMRFMEGFSIILLIASVPWLVLFAMSNRSPWSYDWSKTGIRLLLAGGLLGVLADAPCAPWRLLGMQFPMATPYLLLAACMGYLAGEFWILGQVQMQDTGRGRRILRHASSVGALLLPGLILAAGIANWRIVEGRSGGQIATTAAGETLDRMAGRDILLIAGVFEDSLRICIHERRTNIVAINMAQVASGDYLRTLAPHFADEYLRQPLLRGSFDEFLDKLLQSDAGIRRVGILETPELFQPYGQLIPDGLLYRLEPAYTPDMLPEIVAAQKPFWARMEAMARHPLPAQNLARPYQDMIRQLASLLANNLAVLQLECKDWSGAWETLSIARRIYRDNPSVLLNLLALARKQDRPETGQLEAEWRQQQDRLDGERWALAIRYGYVWQAAEWAAQGFAWVTSGTPIQAPGARRTSPAAVPGETEHAHVLDQIYLRVGENAEAEEVFRMRLMQNERDTEALMGLCRLALRRDQPDLAEAYMREAVAMGLPPDPCRFDRIMIDYVRGETAKALEALETLSRETSGDMRVWMALALLAKPQSPLQAHAAKALENLVPANLGARLSLAELQLSRRHWRAAKAELETAIQLVPKNPRAWELLARTAQAAGDAPLAALSLETLQKLDPHHPLGYFQAAVAACQLGQWGEAESQLRTGLQWRRAPELLDKLAQVLMEQGGADQEIQALMNEAIRQQPGNLSYRCTRVAYDLNAGRIAAAGPELREILAADSHHVPALLLLARWLEARGEGAAASRVARDLVRRQTELDADQVEQLKKLLVYLNQS